MLTWPWAINVLFPAFLSGALTTQDGSTNNSRLLVSYKATLMERDYPVSTTGGWNCCVS